MNSSLVKITKILFNKENTGRGGRIERVKVISSVGFQLVQSQKSKTE